MRKSLNNSAFIAFCFLNSLLCFPIISIFICKSYAHIFACNRVETLNTTTCVQIFKGRCFGTIGTGCTQGKEKRIISREDTGGSKKFVLLEHKESAVHNDRELHFSYICRQRD